MKRLLANLALASILGIFVLPLAASLRQPGLPLCCRPGGKHHCTQNSTEPGFKSKTAAVSMTAVHGEKFEPERPDVSGAVYLTPACSGYRIAGRQLSARGPPDLPR